jgi:hypothetical protein
MAISRQGRSASALRAILACDIVAFGERRPEQLQLYLRDQLYTRVDRALNESGFRFDDCYREDRGDGLFLLLRPDDSLDALVTSVVNGLDREIRRLNQVALADARMRLRVAMHSGQVHTDRHGVTGDAMIHTFRLLNAPRFKHRMRESGARLGAIISDRLYEDVVRPDVGMADPAAYERLRVETKETKTWGWVRLLGVPAPSQTSPGVVPADVLTLAEQLLELPFTASHDGRTTLVNALPDDLSRRMGREREPIMDAYCILRPCVETTAGVAALLATLKLRSPDTAVLGRLERELTALPWLT